MSARVLVALTTTSTPFLHIGACPHLRRQPAAAEDVYEFLLRLVVRCVPQGQSEEGMDGSSGPVRGEAGITWLELLVLYRLARYAEPL